MSDAASEPVTEPATTDGECQDAERSGAGQQVHQHRLDGDQDGAEDHHEQQERHEQYAAEEERQPGSDALGAVDVGRNRPAQVHGEAGAGRRGRNGLVAQQVHEVLRGLVLR